MSKLPPGDGWLPISGAPMDGSRIEVFAPNIGVSIAWWLEGLGHWVEDIGAGYMMPYQDWTHWRGIEVAPLATPRT